MNPVFQVMTRLGLGNGYRHVLSVRGRETRKPHSTPVDVMEQGGRRWLVASYGVTNWVRNARVAGEVRITRGRRPETLRIEEVGPKTASRSFGSTPGGAGHPPVFRRAARVLGRGVRGWGTSAPGVPADLAAGLNSDMTPVRKGGLRMGVSKAVLLTGCSSGIGRAAALGLAGAGWPVDATTRRPLAGLRWYEVVVPAATAGGLAELGTNGP